MSDYCEHDNYASDCKEPGCNERAHPDGKGAMHHTCVDQSTELSTLRGRVQKLEGALRQAESVIRVWHGEPEEAWDIYYANAPEMKAIREALSPNGTEGDTP